MSCPFTHLCPYKDERDVGTVSATWDGDAVELHAFADYLLGFADERLTHEKASDMVARWLWTHDAENVVVTTTWWTAGFDVEVVA